MQKIKLIKYQNSHDLGTFVLKKMNGWYDSRNEPYEKCHMIMWILTDWFDFCMANLIFEMNHKTNII